MNKFPGQRVALAILAGVLLASCEPVIAPASTQKTDAASAAAKSFKVTDSFCAIDTLPWDWWASSSSLKPSLVCRFVILFEGDIAASDVEYARIYPMSDPGSYWSFDLADEFYAADKSIEGLRIWGNGGCQLPVGAFQAEVKLKDGRVSTKDFSIGVPGSVSANGYKFVHDSATTNPISDPAHSAYALGLPYVTSRSAGASSLSVSFVVTGYSVANGYLIFYASSGEYIGRSPYFRDPATGLASSYLEGSTFYSGNQSSNTMTLSASFIQGSLGVPLASIASCRVVVLDGGQYGFAAGRKSPWYDYRAYSACY